MAQISILFAHPYPKSFNHGIANTLSDSLGSQGHTVLLHDLYAESFPPIMERHELGSDMSESPMVIQHQKELQSTDFLIIVHPNWWGQPPAILKGWLDRVLRNGVAYKFGTKPDGSKGMIGLLPIRNLLVITTSNTPSEIEKSEWGDPLESIWIKYVAGFCCFPYAERINLGPVISSTEEQRKEWIQQVCERALALTK